ncbi:glycosyltransferase family 4 protein [Marinobacter sp. F4206]|uniref:glycosyltransferase family 4 protein n=1 Tax=Marinobacter sp. F4206 TaxID=2861777 RepID=UPI001C5D7F14|nr:glycosyltransferase family 4 protein [Marinobacter sp. F4206]MBW4933779.1 glycosyltransferase family 4 protein [Marinobacter sp. F4206]
MRILFLTFYFPPDLSAGSFRAKALADALVEEGSDIQLDVVTTEPNRYRSHKPELGQNNDQRYTVTRIPLPEQRYGVSGQTRAFGSFAASAIRSLPSDNYDIVVATSSRLMTACLGAFVAKRMRAKLYLDVRDIFVETVDDVFTSSWMRPAKWVFGLAERWVLGQASRVNLVSKGFLPYFESRYTRTDYRFFTNGIDEEFLGFIPSEPDRSQSSSEKRYTILYAGNIGDGQGLEHILPSLAVKLRDRAHFVVIGDGGALPRLNAAIKRMDAPVTLYGAMPRSKLAAEYAQADVLFLHLNNLPAFSRVLPSKLFEYAATGKPILAGVEGYAKSFIADQVKGAETFSPCNSNEAEAALNRLALKTYDRRDFVSRYARTEIMNAMAADIIDLKVESDV